MRTRLAGNSAALVLAAVAGLAATRSAIAQQQFYFENFDSAVRDQQSGDPAVVAACGAAGPVWTHTVPTGWSRDDSGMATWVCRETNCGPCGTQYGVREWEGWSFAKGRYNADGSVNPGGFWGVKTDNQNRQNFTLGRGIVAIADSDEWDDRAPGDSGPVQDCGFFNAFMTSTPVSIASIDAGSLSFTFDSSWRPESFDDGDGTNNQTAIIQAIYTVGGVDLPPVEVMHWDSDNVGVTAGDFFKSDAVNETVTLVNANGGNERFPGLNVPAGATHVKFVFACVNAGNDWWWAMDNLRLDATVGGLGQNLWTEDFESLESSLLPPLDETPVGCALTYCGQNTYTHTGPNGVTVAVDSPATGGVPDFRGWSFLDPAFVGCTSGGPNGQGFINASGLAAWADSDEFDDVTNDGPLDTTMSTPAISIASRTGPSILLSFDSSWLTESPQTGTVTAVFNDAANTQVEVIHWDPSNKADAINELVAAAIVVPDDASTVQLKFRYTGSNNWFWGIDNIRLFEGQAIIPVASNTPSQSQMSLAPTYDFPPCTAPWSPNVPNGWSELWNPIGACPQVCGRPEWQGWSTAYRKWWASPAVDTQLRETFTLGTGYVAVADPDEWDDFENGRANFNAYMTTPEINLPGTITTAALNFASSWRDEAFDDTCTCDPEPAASTIVSIAAGNPTVVTTSEPHGFQTGNYVTISGATSAPTLGRVRVNVTSPTTFEVPVETTLAGSGGTATRRPTNNQTAVVTATYTLSNNSTVTREVMRWDSDSGRTASATQVAVPASPFFHNDAPNEAVSLNNTALQVPANATKVKFEFALVNARNDWWWAIDNVDFRINGSSLFSEDFENVSGGTAPPSEGAPEGTCFYFSTVENLANGWIVDNTGLRNCTAGDDFYGFNAWLTEAWARAAGGSARGQFGSETAYVSDFDARGCDGTAMLVSPAFGITNLNENSINLAFRSGWLSAPGHVSRIDVSYDGGPWLPVLVWDTASKASTPDEFVNVNLQNPVGATTLQVRFVDRESGYWAFSDIAITGIVGNPPCDPDLNQDGNVDQADVDYIINVVAGGENSTGIDPDFNRDGNVDQADVDAVINTVAGAPCPQ